MVQWREQDPDFGPIDIYVYAYRAACVPGLFNVVGLRWRELQWIWRRFTTKTTRRRGKYNSGQRQQENEYHIKFVTFWNYSNLARYNIIAQSLRRKNEKHVRSAF